MSRRAEWLIIGGGVHGTHIALRLLDAGIDRSSLRILDPHPRLLDRWRRCSATTGMTHLRSPAVHHLDTDPFALLRFAGPARHRPVELFSAPYDRPSLDLFNRHADALIGAHALHEAHTQGRARRVEIHRDTVNVQLEEGDDICCKHLVLALGVGDQPKRPAWSESLFSGPEPTVAHIFEDGFTLPETPPWRRVAVIGGGISAAQVALRLAADPCVFVTLISRHEPRPAQFDSDPGWLGPKFLRAFVAEHDLDRRRCLINGARHRGSIPPQLIRTLRRTIRSGALRWVQGGVETAYSSPHGVVLEGAATTPVEVDFVLLATGFEARRPGGALVDQLVADYQLPCASCGYPAIDTNLRWHPRIFVSGPLAELQLGPAARNIAGARHAAERITRVSRRRDPATPRRPPHVSFRPTTAA